MFVFHQASLMKLNMHWVTRFGRDPSRSTPLRRPAPAYRGATYKVAHFQDTEISSIFAVLLPVDSSFWSLILTLTFWNSSTLTSLLPDVLRT